MSNAWTQSFDIVEPVAAGVPEQCQQFGCREPVETWCPLCRAFFCAEHDELYPRRMHDCLRGKAEVT
jgi:hypothetical protein